MSDRYKSKRKCPTAEKDITDDEDPELSADKTPGLIVTVCDELEEDSLIGTFWETMNEDIPEDEDENSFIQSQRFGRVVINPPSGHTFFAFALNKNGFILCQPKNHLRVDALVFRKNMEDWLNLNNDEDCRIENDTSKFLTAINQYLIFKENLNHSLTTTLNKAEYLQPSLLHCLLGVPFLQPHVLKVIHPIIAEASYSNTQEEIDLVASLMTQMKWLPILVNGKSLAMEIMDILKHNSEKTKTDTQENMEENGEDDEVVNDSEEDEAVNEIEDDE